MTRFSVVLVLLVLTQTPHLTAQRPAGDDALRMTGPVASEMTTAPNGAGKSHQVFYVRGEDGALSIQFPEPTTISGQWAKALTTVNTVSLLMNAVPVEMVSPELRVNWDVTCVTVPHNRTSEFSSFRLTCLSVRDGQRALPPGGLFRDVTITVVALRGSSSEAFFMAADQQAIVVRLES